MADRTDEIRFLREKARRFREIASTYKTTLSEKLLEIAEEFEQRAHDLEKEGD